MKLKMIFGFILVMHVQFAFSQTIPCDENDQVITSGAKRIVNSYSLISYLDTDFSTMQYCSNTFNEVVGGNFYLQYTDEGGSGMDAYPNVNAGGVKSGGKYYPGDKTIVGMPVTIADIPESLHFEWKTSQENALDADDKWMASINFIFDNYGDENSEPISANRDYDLVVMHESHNFSENLNDLSEPSGTRIWYYARFDDGSLRPYELTIDGVTYKYAVRYKFFVNNGDKDDKSHVKFIPYGNPSTPPVLKINVKEIIQLSKDYIQYAAMPQAYRELAEANVALDAAWLKGINAGYEVYTGQSLLNVDQFKVNLTQYLGLGNYIYNNPKHSQRANKLNCTYYPNPTSGIVRIIVEEAYSDLEVVVSKLTGATVYKGSFSCTEQASFQITGAVGVYFVEVKTDTGKRTVFKVIKS